MIDGHPGLRSLSKNVVSAFTNAKGGQAVWGTAIKYPNPKA